MRRRERLEAAGTGGRGGADEEDREEELEGRRSGTMQLEGRRARGTREPATGANGRGWMWPRDEWIGMSAWEG
jgi:hypothetical protein